MGKRLRGKTTPDGVAKCRKRDLGDARGAQDRASGVRISVRTLAGAGCEIRAERDWTLRDVKEAIAQQLRVRAEEQRLLHGCRLLWCERDTLGALFPAGGGAETPEELTLLVRPPAVVKALGDITDYRHHCCECMSPTNFMNFVMRLPESLRCDREVVWHAVQECCPALQLAPEELKRDRAFMLEAVQRYGGVLQYASEELRGDKEFVLEQVKRSGAALRFASGELVGDRRVVLEAVKQNGISLQYAPEDLKGDKEMVLEAVKQNGYALEYASKELKGNRAIVLEAVKQNGCALRSASDGLKGDMEVVLEAVKSHSFALRFASEQLRRDAHFQFLLASSRRDWRDGDSSDQEGEQ